MVLATAGICPGNSSTFSSVTLLFTDDARNNPRTSTSPSMTRVSWSYPHDCDNRLERSESRHVSDHHLLCCWITYVRGNGFLAAMETMPVSVSARRSCLRTQTNASCRKPKPPGWLKRFSRTLLVLVCEARPCKCGNGRKDDQWGIEEDQS